MARNDITFQVNLRKCENTESKGYGMYYPEAESKEPLSLKGFARHMMSHGKKISYEELVLMLQQTVSCMKEMITQGQPVKLDGLGTFYPTIEGKGAATVELAVQNLTDNIEGVHLRFKAEGAGEIDEKLTSRALKEQCVFEAHDLVKTQYKVIDGKRKSYQERTPLSTYAISQAEPDQP